MAIGIEPGRVILRMHDGQELTVDQVEAVDIERHYTPGWNPQPVGSEVRIRVRDRGEMQMDGQLLASVAYEIDGWRGEFVHDGHGMLNMTSEGSATPSRQFP